MFLPIGLIITLVWLGMFLAGTLTWMAPLFWAYWLGYVFANIDHWIWDDL